MFDKIRLISQSSTVIFDGLDYYTCNRINCYKLSVILREDLYTLRDCATDLISMGAETSYQET